MSESLAISDEWWGSTTPDWGSMIAYRALLGEYGLEPLEWRMHPGSLAEVMAEAAHPGWLSAGWDRTANDGAWTLLGAPLVIDSSLEESRVRVLLRVQSVTLPSREARYKARRLP